MNEQVYAVFTRVEDAEMAISALKDHGVENTEISAVRRGDGVGLPLVMSEADEGLTPTTSADAAAGALKGGSIGLTLGVLGGVLALTVPGFGLIMAAGPLWAAIGAAAAATAAGAATGGVVGYLVDQGIPEHAAVRYQDALNRGDILISVRSAHISNADAIMLLDKYGATETEEHQVGTLLPDTLPASASVEPPIVDRAVDVRTTPVTAAAAPVVEPIPVMETLPETTIPPTNAYATAATTPVSVAAPRVDPVVENRV